MSRRQFGRLPDAVVACVGGGSNAAGMFYPFVDHPEVRLVGVEAGGRSGNAGRPCREPLLRQPRHPPRLASATCSRIRTARRPTCTRCRRASTIRAWAPSTATGTTWAASNTRASPTCEALDAFDLVARNEGILPALETSHALAWAAREAAQRSPDEIIVVCLSGRGDKDAAEIARLRGLTADGGGA